MNRYTSPTFLFFRFLWYNSSIPSQLSHSSLSKRSFIVMFRWLCWLPCSCTLPFGNMGVGSSYMWDRASMFAKWYKKQVIYSISPYVPNITLSWVLATSVTRHFTGSISLTPLFLFILTPLPKLICQPLHCYHLLKQCHHYVHTMHSGGIHVQVSPDTCHCSTRS